MKRTALYSRHQVLGAKLVNFAGYDMPIQYTGIIGEHLAVRNSAGIFDVGHMGEFFISGPGAADFLQMMTINDITGISPFQAQYSAMCNEEGGIIDDILIYRFPDGYMIVVNAANIDKDFHWLKSHIKGRVALEDKSEKINLIAFQGPETRNILQNITSYNLSDLKFYHFTETQIADCNVVLARTGYTGELGYEIYGDENDIPVIWDAILNIPGNKVSPIGLGARDTLRLEMKYCLYGNDIDENTNPIEAGLGWITHLTGHDFIGKEAILEKRKALSRKLICFELLERGIPRQGYSIVVAGEKVGIVTSGSQSPSLQKGIGLGYVDLPYSKTGTDLQIIIRKKPIPAKIVQPPLYKNGTAN